MDSLFGTSISVSKHPASTHAYHHVPCLCLFTIFYWCLTCARSFRLGRRQCSGSPIQLPDPKLDSDNESCLQRQINQPKCESGKALPKITAPSTSFKVRRVSLSAPLPLYYLCTNKACSDGINC